MAVRTKPCPACGAALPERALFCPHCAQDLHARRRMDPPRHRQRGLRPFLLPVVLAALLLLGIMSWRSSAPGVYEGRGKLIYSIDGVDYCLSLSFRNDAAAEPEYAVQVEVDKDYIRSSKLFITQADTGMDAGPLFRRQIAECRVQVLQPEASPAPIRCEPPRLNDDYAPDSLYLSLLTFSGQSMGPAEVVWTLRMQNGDVLHLRQTLTLVPVDTLDYYPEDWPMDTLRDLQVLVAQIQEEVPLPTIVNLHLPPVTYDGGLTLDQRPINLYGSTDEDHRRTTFLGPVTAVQKRGPQCFIEGIDFCGGGSGVGLTTMADCCVENCAFTGWEVGLLVGGTCWTAPIGCRFEENGVGLRFDSAGTYADQSDFSDNVFRNNVTAAELLRVPGGRTLFFSSCQFSGNGADFLNPAGHPIQISTATFT